MSLYVATRHTHAVNLVSKTATFKKQAFAAFVSEEIVITQHRS